MLCFAVGVAAVASGAIGWRRFRRIFCTRLNAQSLLAAAAASMIVLTTAGLAVDHLVHHAAHAGPLDTALLTDQGALPLCSAPDDRTRDIASIEE